MVSAQRVFTGHVPLSAFPRLAGMLADTEGECRYGIEFGRDLAGLATVELSADAVLPMVCQRTLERFLLPITVFQRLALLAEDEEESALVSEDVEPALVGPGGELNLLELVEDELILALPAFPVKPGSTEVEAVCNDPEAEVEVEEPRINPFAALAALKDRKTLGD